MIGALRPAFSRLAAAVVALLCSAAFAVAASDWQVIKVGTRDYLTVDNIAKFYGLPTGVQRSGPEHKSLRLDNGRLQLTVTLDSREAIVNGVRNWLSFPVVEKDGQLLVSRVDLAKTIEPQFRPHMIPNLGKITTIVIDPGHGGHDKGACSALGCEKDYVLDIARQLKPLLEAKGFKVVLTRDSDVFIPLDIRARIANNTRDSIFISLHLNATDTNPAAAGFEIYSLTPRGAPSTQDDALALRFFNMQVGSPVDAPSLALSMSIYHSVLGHLPQFDRGIKRARFAVLRLTKIPAVLVEGGFLTERGESRLIANSQWRAKYAQSISVGIENYKLLVEKRQRPMLLADYQRQLGGELIARDPGVPSPESAITSSAMMNTSNTLGVSSTLSPGSAQSGSVGPANSEQEQEEPGRAVASQPGASVEVAASENATPPAAADEAIPSPMPETPAADTITNPPEPVAANSPAPAPVATAEPARVAVADAPPQPAASPSAPPLRMPSLGSRILRWIPAMPHFQP